MFDGLYLIAWMCYGAGDQEQTSQLHDINWGALDHAPQLTICVCNVSIHVAVPGRNQILFCQGKYRVCH